MAMAAGSATNRRRFLGAALAALRFGSAAPKPKLPKQVLIVRHAEKSGLKTDIHLNARGYERAAALARLFPAKFDTPEALIATRRTTTSNRPVETLTPLSNTLHLRLEDRFGEDEYRELAHALLLDGQYRGKTVLVCWHHGRIPQLAAALGVKNPPSPWPDRQFDRVWRIEYTNGTGAFADLPQHLLEGDS